MVLSGEAELFPLLYHWRVLPGRAAMPDEYIDIETVGASFGDDPAVRRRLQALADASSSLVLFFEFLPVPMRSWLAEDPMRKAALVERNLYEITGALARCELLHMDGHFDNLRTDGERIYLTDFGLATSRRFDLSSDERDFLRRNASHDRDYAAMRLVNWLVTAICGVPDQAGSPPVARNEYVARCAAGEIPNDVPSGIAAILARNAPAAARMNGFYWKLFAGDLSAKYPAPTLLPRREGPA